MPKLDLPIDEFRFLEKMNSSGVRYLLIGGFAVKFYGCRETAEDVDLLIDNSPENAQKLYPIILDSLGYQPHFQLDELSLERKQLKMPNMKIDILTSFDVVEFPVAYERREWGVENETVIPIISKQDLVLIKKEAARDPKRKTKEYIDINCLEGNNVV